MMKFHLIGFLIVCQLILALAVHAENTKEIPIGRTYKENLRVM